MIDLSKLVFHSGYPNFTFSASGIVDLPIDTTFTEGDNTSTIAHSGVDPSSQLVLVFATNHRTEDGDAFDRAPAFYERIIDVGGVPTGDTAYTDIYYDVTVSGDLEIRTYSFANPGLPLGTYDILDDNEIRVVWYVIDMPQ